MKLNDKVQHVYLVGAKSLGAYGGYETFVYKLTEYHQNKENIKYHVACKANGDGCILVRESGTEPVVRVMVEASDRDTCQKYVDEVVNVICEKG